MTKRIVFSFLLLVGTVFAFSYCSKQTETAQPASAQKVRNNKSGSNGTIIARNVNGTPQFVYTQQQMKDAIVSAYLNVLGENITVTHDVEIEGEINPNTQQMEYELVIQMTNSSNEYETFGVILAENQGAFLTTEMGRRCHSITCSKCARDCSYCKSNSKAWCHPRSRPKDVLQSFENELTD